MIHSLTPSKWKKALAVGLGALIAAPMISLPATAESSDDIASQTDAILAEAKLDNRLADNGVTPIAVKDGSTIYGARQSPIPYTADLDQISGTAYFVDCSAQTNGDGTKESPFNSLDAINKVQLSPGDAALFKGGSSCTGTFKPQGSGTEEAPILIDAYDASADNRAVINADGAGSAPVKDANGKVTTQAVSGEAVLLENVEHYKIHNLELTNVSNDDTDYQELRAGLRVVATDMGTATGYEVYNLYVHNVLGDNEKPASGIRFEVKQGSVPTKFSGIDIAYNTLRHVNRTGIVVATDYWQREEAEYWGGSFFPMDPVHIHDNFFTDIGGDGIVVWASPQSIVEYNTLENGANEHGGKSDNSHNAGIWAWVTDGIIFRNNHVFDMHRADDNNDGAAFDADTGGTGQVFEHNLTHDNDGGAVMYCGCWGLSTNITYRYNISLNDGRFVDMVETAEPTGETARTVFMAGSTDSHFYNNTVLLPPTDVNIAGYGHYMDNNVVMANNIYLAQEGTNVSDTTTGEANNTVSWRNNIFAGPAEGDWPSGKDVSDNQIVPTLGLEDGVGLEKLHINSSVVLKTGYPVADPYPYADLYTEGVVTDALGNPVPTVTSPDVGAYQYSEIPPQITVSDGGFENGSQAWALEGAQISDKGQRSGSHVLEFTGKGKATTSFTAAINRTYRIVGAVKPGVGGKLPTISVTLPSGATTALSPRYNDDDQVISDEDGWVPVEVVVRTAFDATKLTLQIDGTEGALVDDISAEGVQDFVIDGSFEAKTNTVWQPPVVVQGTPGNSGESGPLTRSEDAVSGDYSAPVPATGKRINADSVATDFTGDAFNRFTYVVPGQSYELAAWVKADEGKTIDIAWDDYPGWSEDYPLVDENPKDSVSTDATQWTHITLGLTPEVSQISVMAQGNGLVDDMTLVAAWDLHVPSVDGAVNPESGNLPETTEANQERVEKKLPKTGAGTDAALPAAVIFVGLAIAGSAALRRGRRS